MSKHKIYCDRHRVREAKYGTLLAIDITLGIVFAGLNAVDCLDDNSPVKFPFIRCFFGTTDTIMRPNAGDRLKPFLPLALLALKWYDLYLISSESINSPRFVPDMVIMNPYHAIEQHDRDAKVTSITNINTHTVTALSTLARDTNCDASTTCVIRTAILQTPNIQGLSAISNINLFPNTDVEYEWCQNPYQRVRIVYDSNEYTCKICLNSYGVSELWTTPDLYISMQFVACQLELFVLVNQLTRSGPIANIAIPIEPSYLACTSGALEGRPSFFSTISDDRNFFGCGAYSQEVLSILTQDALFTPTVPKAWGNPCWDASLQAFPFNWEVWVYGALATPIPCDATLCTL